MITQETTQIAVMDDEKIRSVAEILLENQALLSQSELLIQENETLRQWHPVPVFEFGDGR